MCQVAVACRALTHILPQQIRQPAVYPLRHAGALAGENKQFIGRNRSIDGIQHILRFHMLYLNGVYDAKGYFWP